MISVTAWAGAAQVNAIAAAAHCNDLKIGFTIKPFCFCSAYLLRSKRNSCPSRRLKTLPWRFQSAKPPQRSIDAANGRWQDGPILPASAH
jgi:hypothetical protein